jgi:hypothetical protein
VTATAAVWLLVSFVLPADIRESIETSFDVAGEVFDPVTLRTLGDPAAAGPDITSQFSNAGNTAFRLLAWVQVLTTIDETSGAWIYGLPMGSGFAFYDQGGYLFENLDPHNDYISILSKVGLIGLGAYLWILWRVARSVLRGKRTQRVAFEGGPAPVMLAIGTLLLLFVSLNAEIRTYGVHFWIWPMLGCGVRLVGDLENRTSAKTYNAVAPQVGSGNL